MAFSVEQRVETFLLEWGMRETLLKLSHYPAETIANHKLDVMHVYRITEQDIKNSQKVGSKFTQE